MPYQGEPGSMPGGVAPRFSSVRIVPDVPAGRRVFSGVSRFPLALLHAHLSSPSSAPSPNISTGYRISVTHGRQFSPAYSSKPYGQSRALGRELSVPGGYFPCGSREVLLWQAASWQLFEPLPNPSTSCHSSTGYVPRPPKFPAGAAASYINMSHHRHFPYRGSRNNCAGRGGGGRCYWLVALAHVLPPAEERCSWSTKRGRGGNEKHPNLPESQIKYAVLNRLACSPPPKSRRTGFNPRPGRRISACGNRVGQCHWSANFLGDLPFPRPFIPALLNTHLTLPSSALKTSLLRADQISSLTHSFQLTLTSYGALDYSPPTRWARVRIFTYENRAGICRCLAGFLGDLLFTPLFNYSDTPYSHHFTLIGSQDLGLLHKYKSVEYAVGSVEYAVGSVEYAVGSVEYAVGSA
ncbi:hypothetical protein PR048_024281 [Dryococelus australis]|uniref:Uncharacterized protein n=1 Tax=Dryococelus australis TaxID=614101 RepID=A0ABQ9GN74_9NEOP|nr:hypothetical protein PR048_024281 [Dryococelus australis]